jgi:3-oxoacyl-[acyl-carrier-protein] synthase II
MTSAKESGQRIVITGVGLVSPVGLTIESLWQTLIAGKGAVRRITAFDPAEFSCQIAAEVPEFDPEVLLNDKKLARRLDRFAQFAIYSGRQAWQQAGLDSVDKERIGIILGNGSGAMMSIEQQVLLAQEKGYRRVTPFYVPMVIPDSASGHLSVEFGTQGPHFSMATACATGADCLGTAMRMIQSGEIDAALAGGAEAGISPIGMAGFMSAKALSTRNDDPATASRPFDKDRDGFVMGEGACVMALESLAHAKARGATILGEILGYGRASDGYEIVSPHPQGRGAIRAMQLALKDAGLSADQVGYVNAHATSTLAGDGSEAFAITQVFGERVTQGKLPVSSTKSMMGHTLGAAGALEALIALLAVKHQMAPPTLNVLEQDPEVVMNVVANQAQALSGIRVAASNSFGFFGHNACLLLGEAP